MERKALLCSFVVIFLCSVGAKSQHAKRSTPCKTPVNANSCYWTHGRLGFSNGTPTLRLWKIGTGRILAIYSGPSACSGSKFDLDPSCDNENPELPANIKQTFEKSRPAFGFPNRIFADFEVCPLESERPGVMQKACIESAKDIVVEK